MFDREVGWVWALGIILFLGFGLVNGFWTFDIGLDLVLFVISEYMKIEIPRTFCVII